MEILFITGNFPSSWKIAKVIPIAKKGKDNMQLNSYRPISLLPHISKIAEIIIKNRILSFVNANKLLVDGQFGFRCGHSTVDQLARLVNALTSNFNDKLHTGALLLDIEKAFDTVWQYGLIYKLIMYNFPRYLILLLNSYLQNRNIFVELNNVASKLYSLHAGVPQGSV